MRTEFAIALALGLVCGSRAAAPTYSCFDPPDVGQTNPFGEGFEGVVEEECCEALIDESDIAEGRLVYWDPINCNHGPGEVAITEAPLCRAHDTDGCRFCRESCEDYEGLCITCEDITAELITAAPTMSPGEIPTVESTPTPVLPHATDVPLEMVSETPSPVLATPASTVAPTMISEGGNDGALDDGECPCITNMTEIEEEVLTRRSKSMRCDSSCSDGSDLIWGVINCNYFDLGQDCRACSESCNEGDDGLWFDDYGIICKPCSAIP